MGGKSGKINPVLMAGIIIVIIVAAYVLLNSMGLIPPQIANIINGFGASNQPVSPENLVSGATQFGNLKVQIVGNGNPIPNVEVDLGKAEPGKGPSGAMTVANTDANGTALFEKVPVGSFAIFFNSNNFPRGYNYVSDIIPVEITDGHTTLKTVTLESQ